ncbi:LruC domain-containing protein [Cyclonatronum proteinivorum]|uniref:LruC domain-containing protein n=1 Tax=Cyclonatronum proteinivorum TaxID=1457365 RepID=A0A345UPF1_9BACT|nr:LruC domain-containing protein [Cyclonatronum proteinivorum]AXJ02353.1 LruC domain-containing protein [Cyclonatronum proteinivorum]
MKFPVTSYSLLPSATASIRHLKSIAFISVSLLFWTFGFSSEARAQVPISSISAVYTSVDDASNDYSAGRFSYFFNTGSENDLLLLNVEAAGRTFTPALFANRIEMQRVSIPGIPDEREIFYYQGEVTGNNVNLNPGYISSMQEALLNPIMNRGVDNIFQNTGDNSSNVNNVMRLDFIFDDGIEVPALVAEEGFIIKERGGNDRFRIAAITSLDASGNPASFAPAVLVEASDWGPTGYSFRTQVMRRPNPNVPAEQSANVGPQPMSGILFTFEILGLSPGQTIYGYSITAGDAPANSADWFDVSTFPTNTNATDGGLDIAAGGAYFSANPVIVAEDDFYSIGIQTTLEGSVGDNDTFQPGSTFALEAEPAEGVLTFNPDGTFTYTPDPFFEGTDTFTYSLCLPDPLSYLCDTGEVSISVEPSLTGIINFFPASGPGTLAFEDLWPAKGDFDFNDMVVDYQFQISSNNQNIVERIEAVIVLRAFGAAFRNGFGFQLSENIQQDDIVVSGFSLTEDFITLNPNGTEAGQSKPTIIVFDNTYTQMQHPGAGTGVNTEPTAPYVQPAVFFITIEFVGGSYTYSDVDISSFNPFLIVNGNRGREIHLPGYPPTDLANMDLFGTSDDRSSPSQNRWYVTKNNLPWAINLIHRFDYPVEQADIIDAYPRFIDWAQSGGTQFQDWFSNTADQYRNWEKIFIEE